MSEWSCLHEEVAAEFDAIEETSNHAVEMALTVRAAGRPRDRRMRVCRCGALYDLRLYGAGNHQRACDACRRYGVGETRACPGCRRQFTQRYRAQRHCSKACAQRVARRGERNGNARLTELAVRAIKAALRQGVSAAVLAVRSGVKPPAIEAIRRGRNWRHVQ